MADIDVQVIHKTGRFVDVAGINNHTVNDLEIVAADGEVHSHQGNFIFILN